MSTFTKRIAETNDDGKKSTFAPYYSYYTNQCGLGYYQADNSDSRIGVFRFTNVTIPQGATILSAKLTLRNHSTNLSAGYKFRIYGVAEDNTASFSSDPTGRTKTSAYGDWDTAAWTYQTDADTADFTSVIQEIVNRGGWSDGNSLGLFIYSRLTGNTGTFDVYDYQDSSSYCALLTITYVFAGSESASISATLSPSPSVSISKSPSISPSVSPSPSPMPPAFFGLKIAKPGVNVLTNSDIDKLIFSSDYGTLKYFSKQNIDISFNAAAPDSLISAVGTYDHDLGYYPYCEVFVRVYTGDTPTGNYEYCPFYGAGATIFYSATYLITKTQIKVYGEINGVSASVWHFDFLIFIFKNDLNL